VDASIEKLDEMGRRWGFEIQIKSKFSDIFSHRFHANGRKLKKCQPFSAHHTFSAVSSPWH
jgi:hypothetical protein